MTNTTLILFDIDGTLLLSDGVGRAALKSALMQTFGTYGGIDQYRFGGRTDRKMVVELMLDAGIARTRIDLLFPELCVVLERELAQRIQSGHFNVRPCEGGLALIEALSTRTDAIIGIVTGNITQTAHLKLETAGYVPDIFSVGGYGEMSENRADLVGVAIEEAKKLTNSEGDLRVIVVGDTPADVISGKAHHSITVAVLTGHASRAELEESQPTVILEDFTDKAYVLQILRSL